MKVTPLIAFYGLFTAAGAVVPWYFNLRCMREAGEMLTLSAGWLTVMGTAGLVSVYALARRAILRRR